MSHRHAAHPASTPCTPGIARRAGRRHRRPPQPQAPARWLSRFGGAGIGAAALAAACVLTACGPEDSTAAAVVPAPEPAAVTLPQPMRALPRPPEPLPRPRVSLEAQAVPAGAVVKVADVGDRGWRSERAEAGPPRSLFGEVTAIEPIKQAPPSSGAGAVVGGVLGAVVGNQVGSGSGRAAATVIGGVGGAVVGNKVEKRRNEQVVGYRIHVQLDRGGMRSFERAQLNGIDVGDRVRIDGSRLREI
ncbi:glycine zipper 2TM domain-containing protein [Piscinibacter sakaiensis]|uniref:Outer membrane lipoprotein n=1 Tax=Piscinibacter sakaiensis TaxID=1547922 RepID=A0A0K8NZ28_PISS1|nr:glycine zipper 2TM domain-containing protein [Piscinibacter sakaiensis]GAP35155.1 outer membrane lipoprotein [Piscinibacter sakaiensis]